MFLENASLLKGLRTLTAAGKVVRHHVDLCLRIRKECMDTVHTTLFSIVKRSEYLGSVLLSGHKINGSYAPTTFIRCSFLSVNVAST